jgi:hypothetical protein
MPKPCSVCAHNRRAEIDGKLAQQVVNLSAVGRDYGLKRDALRAHRSKHIPSFLPMLIGRAEVPSVDALAAEAERLYAVSLDALARAEAGVLVQIDDDGTEVRKVSSTAIARMIREARGSLDLLVKLSTAGATSANSGDRGGDAALGARIEQALDKVMQRAIGQADDVIDVEVVADEPPAPPPHPGT